MISYVLYLRTSLSLCFCRSCSGSFKKSISSAGQKSDERKTTSTECSSETLNFLFLDRTTSFLPPLCFCLVLVNLNCELSLAKLGTPGTSCPRNRPVFPWNKNRDISVFFGFLFTCKRSYRKRFCLKTVFTSA